MKYAFRRLWSLSLLSTGIDFATVSVTCLFQERKNARSGANSVSHKRGQLTLVLLNYGFRKRGESCKWQQIILFLIPYCIDWCDIRTTCCSFFLCVREKQKHQWRRDKGIILTSSDVTRRPVVDYTHSIPFSFGTSGRTPTRAFNATRVMLNIALTLQRDD